MEVGIVFCSNCGSKLAEGAKFCSECGARIEDIQVRPFDTQAFKESIGATGTDAEEHIRTEKAFQDRVSFDWSNVIDEPHKKEVPQGIKSPWAATSGSISERELYSEMTQSDDKSRTMDFIDVLKADREEREKAALDSSIEYTEVLEIDPEVLGGTKPPKLRYAPLYDDVDEPVKTPYDDMPEPAEEAVTKDTTSYQAPAADIPKETDAVEKKQDIRRGTPKFEIPDFLKKAVNFGARDEEPEVIPKAAVEEPIFEEDSIENSYVEAPEADKELETELEKAAGAEIAKAAEAELDQAAEAETAKAAVEEVEKAVVASAAPEEAEKEAVTSAVEEEVEKAAVTSAVEESLNDSTENLYLDEDLYLDIEENRSGTARMSRVDAHTLAGMYDESDLDDDGDIEEETYTNVDEKELFNEMSETPAGHTGMTIAAPADEEAEIEALKRRLAELTGAIDMSSAAPKEPEEAPAPLEEVKIPEGSFESLGSDFKFEPEVTKAEDNLFEGLKPAREASVEDAYLEVKNPEPESPKLEDFTFEPELTEKDNELFEALTPASEPAAEKAPEAPAAEALKSEEPANETKSFGLGLDDKPAAAVTEEAVYEAHNPEELKFEAPAPTISADQKEAFDKLVFDFPQAEKKEAEPVPTGLEAFASEVKKEEPKVPEFIEPEFEIPAAEPARGLSADAEPAAVAKPVADAEVTAVAKPVPVIKETPVSLGLEPKVTDAVSLEDLENDLFGEIPDDAEPETTKKIDKFYTLYRKNEEFQRLLDEEYSRLKGDNINVPKEEAPEAAASSVATSLEDFTKADSVKMPEKAAEPAPEAESQARATAAILEELTEKSRPVEDATIYKIDTPEAPAEAAPGAELQAADTGFSVGGNAVSGSGLGLDGTEAAAAAAAAGAGAVAVATKQSKREAKKAEKEAKKAARKAAKAAKNADPQVEYEEVDGGSTFLTVLAVLIAILLVVLLAVILILHIAPNSGPAMAIDEIIERLTSGASSLSSMGGIKWL